MLDALIQVLDDCRGFVLQTPSGSRRVKYLDHIKEILTVIGDDDGLLADSLPFGKRGGDHKFNAKVALAGLIHEHTSELIAKLDTNGDFLWSNAAHVTTLGYSRRFLFTAALTDLAPPGGKDAIRAHLQRALKEGRALDTLCVRHCDGTERWIESNSTRIREGGSLHVLVIARDVTERKLVEDALRDREAKHRAVLRAIPDLLLQVNAAGVIVDRPTTACAASDLDHVLGQRLTDLLPDVGARLVAQVQRVLTTDRPEVGDYACCWPWRHARDYEATVVPSGPGEALIMWRDVTERKRAERAERENQERYRQMFEETAAVKLVIDPVTRRIVDANPAAAAFYAYNRATLTTLCLDDLVDLRADRLERTLQWFMRGERTTFMYRCRLASGEMREIEVCANPVTINGQRLLYWIVQDATERQQEETARRMSDAHLALMVEQLPAMVWMAGPDLVVRWMSGKGMAAAGLSADQTFGLALRGNARLGPDHPIVRGHEQALAGVTASFALDTRGRSLQVTIAPFRDSLGEIIGCLGTCVDVTEHVALTHAVAASEQNYRTLLEQAADPILVAAPDGQIITSNAAAAEIFGYTPHDFAALRLGNILAPGAFDPAALPASTTLRTESRLRHADGRWLAVGISVRRMPDGTLQAIVRDITARTRYEQRYRALFDRTSDAVLLVGLDERVFAVNQEATRMFGYTATELSGQPTMLFVAADQLPQQRALWQHLLAGTDVPVFEHSCRARNGRTFPVEVAPALVRDADGQPMHVQIILRDISARKRAEQQERLRMQHELAAAKLERLGLLAGGIGHDFNTFVHAIMGNLDLAQLELEPRGVSPVAERLGAARFAIRQARALFDQLLAVAGDQVDRRQRSDLNHLIADTLRAMQRALPAAATITTAYAPDLEPVAADPSQLSQVVLNLLVNAGDALQGQSGTIRIATAMVDLDATTAVLGASRHGLTGHYVRLDVADTGCGMDAATQARIFEPFFTTKPHGRGMGLAALHGIVQAHGGAIETTSAPGVGTRMRVYLPVAGRDEDLDDVPLGRDGALSAASALVAI